jgi:hypothetical protein
MVGTEARPASPSPGATLYGIYVVSLGTCLLGNLLIRIGAEAGWFGSWMQAALAVITCIPLVVAAAYFWRLLRRDLDEMLQRVVLEGMGAALIVYVPLAALYVNLRTAGVWVPRLDPPDILFTPALLVAIGIAVAWKRYQ